VAADTPPERSSRRVQSVERAAALLKAVAEPPEPPSLVDVARACGLNRSTAWRLLLTLEDSGLVERDAAGGYTVGSEVSRLALRGGNQALVRRLRPVLVDLVAGLDMAACLVVPGRGDALAIDQVDPPGRPETSMVGWTMPLHASAAGKVHLAHLGEAALEEALRGPLERFTAATPVDAGAVRAELGRIGADGVVLSRDEWDPGWTGVAAPVRRGRSLVAILTVIATSPRFDAATTRRALAAVKRAARDASDRLAA
jgi:IclR family acetate operon transcriptional repressor